MESQVERLAVAGRIVCNLDSGKLGGGTRQTPISVAIGQTNRQGKRALRLKGLKKTRRRHGTWGTLNSEQRAWSGKQAKSKASYQEIKKKCVS